MSNADTEYVDKVREWLVLIAESDNCSITEMFSATGAHVDAEKFLDAAEQVLAGPMGIAQIVAAAFILKCREGLAIRNEAVRALQAAINSNNPYMQWNAISWLNETEATTNELIPELARFLDRTEESPWQHIVAASAIYGALDPSSDEGLLSKVGQILLTTIREGDSFGVLLASKQLLKRGNCVDSLGDALIQALDDPAQEIRTGALSRLAQIANPNSRIICILSEYATNQEIEQNFRLMAISGLARNVNDNLVLDQVFQRLLRDNNPYFRLYALAGLNTSKREWPESGREVLLDLLASTNLDCRGGAAQLIAESGERAIEFLEPLIAGLTIEQDGDVCEAMLNAISCCGKQAIPRLIEVLSSSGPKLLPVIQRALLCVGRDSVLELAEMCASDNKILRQSGVWLLHSLGPKAAQAVPRLLSLLNSPDKEVVQDIVVAFCRMGPFAVDAVEPLARLVISGDEDVSQWAKAGILNVGYRAVKLLRSMVPSLNLDSANKIQAIIDELTGEVGTTGREKVSVMGVSNRKDLERFRLVATIFQEFGPCSFNDIASEIDARIQASLVKHDLGLSASGIRLLVRRIEKAMSNELGSEVKLFSNENNRKGTLTRTGKMILQKVNVCLETS